MSHGDSWRELKIAIAVNVLGVALAVPALYLSHQQQLAMREIPSESLIDKIAKHEIGTNEGKVDPYLYYSQICSYDNCVVQ